MDPQIRYATTSDGMHIAWYAIGSGTPYVWPAGPSGAGLADAWRIPEVRALLESIAQRFMLVVFDPRGFGLSDRGATDFTCDAVVRDLEAVVDAAGLGPFVLQTWSFQSVPAIAYAARHPDRVRALVLLNGVLRGPDMSDQWQRLVRLAREDWEYAKALIIRTNEASYSSAATLEQAEKVFTRGATQDTYVAFCEATAGWDASDVTSGVDAPALVVHYGPRMLHTTPDASRRLAAALPRGTFAPLEFAGAAESPFESAQRVVRDFLRTVFQASQRQRTPRAQQAPTGTAVILFTDIADSAALTERLGDSAFRKASRVVDDGVRGAIRDAGGTPVEGAVLGDGVMGVFPSGAQAISAARACVNLAAADGFKLHVGVHAGDVIREEHNVYGGAVNIASRICALCEPGEILVSATVRDLARTSAGVAFEDRGEHVLKGIADPIRVYAARAQSGVTDRT